MLQTMNETEKRKLKRNFKLKNSTESNHYQPASPYTANQSGFSTMHVVKSLEPIPDDLVHSVEDSKVSQKYLRTKKIKKQRRSSRSPVLSQQSPKIANGKAKKLNEAKLDKRQINHNSSIIIKDDDGRRKKSDAAKPPKSIRGKKSREDVHLQLVDQHQKVHHAVEAILAKPASRHKQIAPVANFNEHDFIVFRQNINSGRSSGAEGHEYTVKRTESREEEKDVPRKTLGQAIDFKN